MATHSSHTTTRHDEIKKWVEQRGGHPATVRGTAKGEAAGLLRIDFPGGVGAEKLEPVTWDDFFHKFDESGLAFVYDTDKKSRFCKFVTGEKSRRRNP